MHPTIRIFCAFFLAIALGSGVLYAIDHAPGSNAKSVESVEKPAKTVAAAAPAENPAPPAAAASAPPTASATAAPAAIPAAAAPDSAGAIAKCSIDGKIVYTDKGCPQGSKAKSLQITDNAVIPGVDQATIERTLRQPAPRPPQLAQATPPAAVLEPPVTSITTEAGVDCPALGRRIEWLGYMAHRRQPPYMRDRMRRERDDLQTRWFWAHC